MNKFNKVISEMWGIETIDDLKKLALEAGFSDDESTRIAKFLDRRFSAASMDPNYAAEQMERFKRKTMWCYADLSGQLLLSKMGLEELAGKSRFEGNKDE